LVGGEFVNAKEAVMGREDCGCDGIRLKRREFFISVFILLKGSDESEGKLT
jgi:hypothetical protein